MIRFARFNIYLLALTLLLAAGCKTAEEKKKSKELTLLFVHIETNSDGSERNKGVTILRSSPIEVNIERDPFLTQNDVEAAFVVANPQGGFWIKVQFNRHGALLLENASTTFKGKRFAILSQFGDARWLAAPIITQRITNGQLVFTPDATFDEAERIVRGLNNVAAQARKKNSF